LNCNIKFGDFTHSIEIELPYKKGVFVFIDKCLLSEIIELWKMGVITGGNCCGHGKLEPTICIMGDESIKIMKKLGYKNTTIYKDRKDIFIAKSKLRNEVLK